MKGIEPYSREQLEDQSLLDEVKRRVDYYLRYDNGLPGEERVQFCKLRLKLEESIRRFGPQIDKKLRRDYIDSIVKLNFLQLNLLSNAKIIELFKKYFLLALKSGINIEEKIRAKAMGLIALYEIDPFIDDIKNALKENVETLGTERITIGSSEKLVKPYIKNWLLDYDNAVGAKSQGEIEISGYIFKSKNTRKLSPEEKQLLKQILVLYEKLKLDMTSPNSIATLSLSFFGIKSTGTGLSKRFAPMDGSKIKEEKSEPTKPAREKIKYTKRPSDLMPQQPLKPATERRSTPENLKKISETKEQGKTKIPAEKQITGLNQVQKPTIKKRPSDLISQQPVKNVVKPVTPSSEMQKPEKKKAEENAPQSSPKSISQDTINKLSSSEKLSKLTVRDFRSLGVDVKSAGEYLLNRIKKISSISPVEREACKNFLRQSELYKIYLEQGRLALDTKKNMSEIVANRKAAGREYLEEEEFNVLRNVFKSI